MHVSQWLCFCVLLKTCIYDTDTWPWCCGLLGTHGIQYHLMPMKQALGTRLSFKQSSKQHKGNLLIGGIFQATRAALPCVQFYATFQTASKGMMPLVSGVISQSFSLFSRAAPLSKSLTNLNVIFKVNTPRKGNHKSFKVQPNNL